MRFLVYGTGAIGLWLAIRLQNGGHQVSCIARQPIVDAMQRHDVTLSPLHGPKEYTAPLMGYVQLLHGQPGLLQNLDYILLCVKAYSVSTAIDELIQCGVVRPDDIQQNPTILCFQNGIGSEEAVAGKVGRSRVIAATTTMPVTMPTPGHVYEERDHGAICLAPLQGAIDQRLLEAFRGSRVQVEAHHDHQSLKWSKLLLNMMGNATSAILDMSVEDVYRDVRLYRLEMQMLKEMAQVAEASGVHFTNLPNYPAATLAFGVRYIPMPVLHLLLSQRVGKGRGAKRPSLYYELLNKTGRSEMAWLNGAVVTRAKELRMPTPVNTYLAMLYERLMSGKQSWDEWRGRVDRLLADIDS